MDAGSGTTTARGEVEVRLTAPADRERVERVITEAFGDEGRSIVIFPEGTRVRPGESPPLRAGFAGLYRALGVPVVPVALDSGRLWPRAGAKRAGTVTFRFGAPVPPGLPRAEVEAAVHRAMNALEAGQGAFAPSGSASTS